MLGILLSACLLAQGNFASIEGRIVDISQRPVAGVLVEVRSKGTGATRMTQTNESGLFEVPSLPPAEYLVDVTAVNFSPVRLISLTSVPNRISTPALSHSVSSIVTIACAESSQKS